MTRLIKWLNLAIAIQLSVIWVGTLVICFKLIQPEDPTIPLLGFSLSGALLASWLIVIVLDLAIWREGENKR